MLVLKTKVQTFLALIISTIAIGVIGGMLLTATDVVAVAKPLPRQKMSSVWITGMPGHCRKIGIISGWRMSITV